LIVWKTFWIIKFSARDIIAATRKIWMRMK